MGVRMNLPPRYVQLCPSPSDEKGITAKPKNIRTVNFEEQANQTFSISRLPKKDIWYNACDYRTFGYNWRHFKRETVLPKKRETNLLVGQRSVPPMEGVQTFGKSARGNRRLLVHSVLMHQASCRAHGYNDPDGCSMLSKALSKNDRQQAGQSAAANAYEAECFRNEVSSTALTQLFFDYYMESIHPYLNSPMVFFSKVVLCELD